jgi:Reverse transcriptase (RNA-dependent DNA polymerase)
VSQTINLKFGSLHHFLFLDTAPIPIHDIEAACTVGLKCSILLFDIKGFFNHLSPGNMVAVLKDMGFPPEIASWMCAFPHDKKVHLSLNGLEAQERDQPVGVPQGLPVSLAISVTYMLSLLHKMDGWNNSCLVMYVNNGIVSPVQPCGWTLLTCFTHGTPSVKSGSESSVWPLSQTRWTCSSSRSQWNTTPSWHSLLSPY